MNSRTIQRPSMSIYVLGSSRHLKEDMPYYRKIIDTIFKHGHILSRNWIEPAFQTNIDGSKNAQMDWEAVLADNMATMALADAVIMEGTWYGFAEGYFTLAALQQKKPVLFLMRDGTPGEHIASGINDDLFTIKTYHTEEELERIVGKFIQENELTSKDLRFNFFLDREIYNHLRWTSFKTGKTKAEIIRDLIEEEIDKKG